MDRYQIFHQIITGSDIASMRSILRHTLDILIRLFGTELGAYFASGHGGLRCLVARNRNGVDIARPEKQFPSDLFQRVVTTHDPMNGEMPRISGGHANTLTGKTRIIRFAAVPAVTGNQVLGVVYLERRYQQPSFQKSEILLLSQLLEDVQKLLNSSRDFEKQSFELDTMKSQVAMSQVHLISRHPTMLHLFRYIQKLAKVPSTVLIQGESGTGKELVARAIYELGNYSGPFLSMNCGGIESNLMKSELFGYLKGSFTGAQKDRPGLFKKAENGVLFMDEIGEMPMDMQVAMLRTLESREILAVGSDAPLQVNTRVVAATHCNLRDMVAEGRFRNDLFQRLKGLTLMVPPLRDRRTDIPHLCGHFIKKYNERLSLHFKEIRPEAMELLTRLDYASGNVRELEHMIERAMVFEDDEERIGTEYLSPDGEMETSAPAGNGTFEELMNHYAGKVITEAIEACRGNKTRAMKKLGLSRSTFYGMLHRYGLN